MAVRYRAGCWGRTGAELGHAWPRFPSHGWVAAAYRCWANPQPRSPPGSQKDAGSSAGAEPVGQHRGGFGAAQGLRGWEFLSAIYWSFSLHGEGAAGALTRVWRGVERCEGFQTEEKNEKLRHRAAPTTDLAVLPRLHGCDVLQLPRVKEFPMLKLQLYSRELPGEESSAEKRWSD